MVQIRYNPYEGVDWGSVEYHKSEFHQHARGNLDNAGMIDLYEEAGYTIYAQAPSDSVIWPWSEVGRDPEEMGVVAFPAMEWHEGYHQNSLFTTAGTDKYDITLGVGQLWKVQKTIEDEQYFVPAENGGISSIAHPESAEHVINALGPWRREQGAIGMEVFNARRWSDAESRLNIWDSVLEEFAPERVAFGFGVDDPGDDVEIGDIVDTGVTTLLIPDGGFDPSDQEASRVEAAQAYLDGRSFAHIRDPWDNDTENGTPLPHVESIVVDGLTVTIDAIDYDSIEWISSGEVVETGDTIEIDESHIPYVRARLENDDAITCCQPITIEEQRKLLGGS